MSTLTFIDAIKDQTIALHAAGSCFASITIAQAITESASGTSGLSDVSNNLFGMKGTYQGQYVLYRTKEYINGEAVYVDAKFKKYPSWNESVTDHAALLAKSRYIPVIQAATYQQAAQALYNCGYATDPMYARNLIAIIEHYNLAQYDTAVPVPGPGTPAVSTKQIRIMKRYYIRR